MVDPELDARQRHGADAGRARLLGKVLVVVILVGQHSLSAAGTAAVGRQEGGTRNT